MSLERSPDHDVPYHLVAFDREGTERAGAAGPASAALVDAVELEEPTDVFLFSHGWNSGPRDALDQYGAWVDAMAARDVDRARLHDRTGGFRPLLVGLHWPSKAWADEDLTSLAYGVDAVQRPAASGVPQDTAPSEHQQGGLGPATEEYLESLGDDETTQAALRTILAAAHDDAAPPTLPPEVRRAYETIDTNLAFGAAGAGAPPGADREPFDAEETYQAGLLLDVVDAVSFGGLSMGGLLAPLRVLSFWAMKRRALHFGENAAARLLATLQRTAGPETRVHVAGHSFGCIVACAAVSRAAIEGGGGRPVTTLVLLQGAMSHWSFSDDIPARPGHPGYFHGLVRDSLVSGPVLVTTSVHDRALRSFYPLGAGARAQVEYGTALPLYGAVGTFGTNGPGLRVVRERVEDVGDAYAFEGGTVYNLNADAVIANGSGPSGAHSDIARPEIARAVRRAVERR
ncbi:hypothetical protein ACWFNE_09315 [Cellulomonas sp. NPDC055163]